MSKYVVGWFMVFNPAFNNISVKSWWSVLLVEETGVPGENHRHTASHWQTQSHNVVSSTHRHELGSNSQLKWWKALIAQVVVNPTTILLKEISFILIADVILHWRDIKVQWNILSIFVLCTN